MLQLMSFGNLSSSLSRRLGLAPSFEYESELGDKAERGVLEEQDDWEEEEEEEV